MSSSFEKKEKRQSNLSEHQPKRTAKFWRGVRSCEHILHSTVLARVGLSTSVLQMIDWSYTWLFMDLADIWLSRNPFFL